MRSRSDCSALPGTLCLALFVAACSGPSAGPAGSSAPTGEPVERAEPIDLEARFDVLVASLAPSERRAVTSEGSLAQMLAFEATWFLADLDADGDARLTGAELADLLDDFEDDLEPAMAADWRAAGAVSATDLYRLLSTLESAVAFEVDGERAHMRGTIDSTTPRCVRELLRDHPGVTTIVMHDVPGSVDDEANLRAGLLVRRAGLAIHLPAAGEIASGGTDFFLAGATRSLEPGALVGVHSWGGDPDDPAALDYPEDHEVHELYLDYYEALGVDAEFYWFTLRAASEDGIHWMTADELAHYGFETKR